MLGRKVKDSMHRKHDKHKPKKQHIHVWPMYCSTCFNLSCSFSNILGMANVLFYVLESIMFIRQYSSRRKNLHHAVNPTTSPLHLRSIIFLKTRELGHESTKMSGVHLILQGVGFIAPIIRIHVLRYTIFTKFKQLHTIQRFAVIYCLDEAIRLLAIYCRQVESSFSSRIAYHIIANLCTPSCFFSFLLLLVLLFAVDVVVVVVVIVYTTSAPFFVCLRMCVRVFVCSFVC